MATKTYLPNEARQLSDRELRREYARLRRVANKRLTNLEKRGLGTWGDRRFGSARGRSSEYVEAALLEVSRYLRDPRHTVKGETEFRSSVLNALHKDGYNFINENNFYDFTKYMDKLRTQYSEKVFDSTDAVQVFNNMERLKIDPELLKDEIGTDIDKDKIDYLMQNAHKLEQVKLLRKTQRISFEDLQRRIDRIK